MIKIDDEDRTTLPGPPRRHHQRVSFSDYAFSLPMTSRRASGSASKLEPIV